MKVYLDNGATTRLDPRVLKTMMPFFRDRYGNASSLHNYGRDAATAIQASREKVAELLGAEPHEIVFTSGGTESDNMAIKGTALIGGTGKKHVITSMIEHPAVLDTCRYLEDNFGVEVTRLPVDGEGFVRPDDVEKAIKPHTVLISIMHTNNEIGTIEPVLEIGKIARKNDIIFHTDAVQSVGKVKIDVKSMNIDLLSLSGHKMHGPKGVGALYVRKGINIEPILHGGGHERALRSGTENVPGIVGLGTACKIVCENMDKDNKRMSGLRDKLIKGILEKIESCRLNGPSDYSKRLPNNCNVSFSAVEGESLVMSLDLVGIAASTGSACSSKKLEPSHVLKAIGLKNEDAYGSLRLTLSRETTEEEIDYVLEQLPKVVAKLRSMSPLWKRKQA